MRSAGLPALPVPIVGHGVEQGGEIFCASSARSGGKTDPRRSRLPMRGWERQRFPGLTNAEVTFDAGERHIFDSPFAAILNQRERQRFSLGWLNCKRPGRGSLRSVAASFES